MSSQQTVLRVQTNIPSTTLTGQTESRDLDLYSDVPIKIFRSFAEVQDISKRNSDYTIGLSLPGSKRNNVFFENFYDVNQQTLYFDATKRVPTKVMIDGDIYFRGYLKLDKINIIDTKIEYGVTLYSEIADLYGAIGNGLLKDLDYSSINHELRNEYVINNWNGPNYQNGEPSPYLYSVIHNGYLYDGEFPDYGITNLYTSTITGYWSTLAEAQAATLPNRINSVQSADSAGGIYLNQLKPALNVKWLVDKIITERGYTIKSDFFNTPWFKLLYLYGYFNSADSVLSATFENYEVLPKTGVDIRYIQEDLGDGERKITYYVVKRGTGIPVICSEPLYIVNEFKWDRFFLFPDQYIRITQTITPNNTTLIVDTTKPPYSTIDDRYDWNRTYLSSNTGGGVGFYEGGMTYLPEDVGDTIPIGYGDEVNFAKIMSKDIKQIDFLASIAKKFNLLFIPNPDNPKELLIEPYDYYIGTGNIYDWSDKLATDKGYSIEPAVNFIESELILTDKEDGDAGNKSYKDKFDRIYGENKVYNPTEFKSSTKTIDTIFSPQIISKWDVDITNPKVGNIGLPLAINYVEGTSTLSGDDDNEVNINIFEGVKTKPKLFYHGGNFSPFLDAYGELIQTPFSSTNFTTWYPKIQRPGSTQVNTLSLAKRLPVVSHTIPTGNPDSNKITNDSACILFSSEQPVNLAGVPTYNTYTDNDLYALFYDNRINNLFNPQTRFVKAKFDLKLNDVKNLKPNDIIKLNGQYFTWNKIAGYDLTNPPQLTEVELIQVEINPKVYPTRYFEYYYNDNPSVKYSIVSDFTNETYEGTNYAWSMTYDYYVGVLGGSVSGFTSSVKDTTQGTFSYIPYTIYEISKENYLTGSTINRSGDPIYIWSKSYGPDLSDTYPVWGNSASGTDTYEWLNVFSNYSDFQSKRSPWFFTEGVSNTHGSPITPTPTATPSPTPTPLPDQQEPGSLIITYNNLDPYDQRRYYSVYVNSVPTARDRNYSISKNLYTTYLNDDNLVDVFVNVNNILLFEPTYTLIRRDYTNDDQGGDMGIIDTDVTSTIGILTGSTSYSLQFRVTTNPEAYNYEYRLELGEQIKPPSPPSPPDDSDCYSYLIEAPYIITQNFELYAEGPEVSYIDHRTNELRYAEVYIYEEKNAKCFRQGFRPDGSFYSYQIPCAPNIYQFTEQTVIARKDSVSILRSDLGIVVTELDPCPTGSTLSFLFSVDIESMTQRILKVPIQVNQEVTIDWGDGVTGTTSSDFPTHTYDAIGSYFVEIYPTIATYDPLQPVLTTLGRNANWAATLLTVESFGDLGWTSFEGAFSGVYSRVIQIPTSIPSTVTNLSGIFRDNRLFNNNSVITWDVSNVTDMSNMFNGAREFNRDISGWDVSSVTNMSGMFQDARKFNTSLGSWDVSNVTDFSNFLHDALIFNNTVPSSVDSATNLYNMFRDTLFNQDISGWNVSGVTNMSGMFAETFFNRDLSGWDVGNVTDMSFMFFNNYVINTDITGWDVSNVTNMESMFERATGLALYNYSGWTVGNVTNMKRMFARVNTLYSDLSTWDISNVNTMSGMFSLTTFLEGSDYPFISSWDVSNVTDMSNMFSNSTNFTNDITNWNVSGVTNMSFMFNNSSFNQPIGNWNVSKVTTMERMFGGATAFNQDIGSWDTSRVTNMRYMFSNASAFNQDISGWNISKVKDMSAMFYRNADFNQDISSWSVSGVINFNSMFESATSFNQDLSGWCVPNIPLVGPTRFSLNATSWVLPQPYWGFCGSPVTPTPTATATPTPSPTSTPTPTPTPGPVNITPIIVGSPTAAGIRRYYQLSYSIDNGVNWVDVASFNSTDSGSHVYTGSTFTLLSGTYSNIRFRCGLSVSGGTTTSTSRFMTLRTLIESEIINSVESGADVTIYPYPTFSYPQLVFGETTLNYGTDYKIIFNNIYP